MKEITEHTTYKYNSHVFNTREAAEQRKAEADGRTTIRQANTKMLENHADEYILVVYDEDNYDIFYKPQHCDSFYGVINDDDDYIYGDSMFTPIGIKAWIEGAEGYVMKADRLPKLIDALAYVNDRHGPIVTNGDILNFLATLQYETEYIYE